jgi:regulator of sirC expression with transglutaminase-like and TPR domain
MAEGFSYSKNTAQERTYRAFEALITGNENSIDLAEAALLIASIEYPDLDRTFYLRQLDELARQVRAVLDLPYPETLPQLPEEIDPLRVLEAMNRVIFEKEQFHGNRQDYSSPDNSFFNKVLENRAGIPITLSLLYIEVGRRVGVTIEGIGLPWHFVVRYCLPQEIIYIDVFNQGHFMDERACRDMIRNMAQTRIRMHAEWFEPVKPRQTYLCTERGPSARPGNLRIDGHADAQSWSRETQSWHHTSPSQALCPRAPRFHGLYRTFAGCLRSRGNSGVYQNGSPDAVPVKLSRL